MLLVKACLDQEHICVLCTYRFVDLWVSQGKSGPHTRAANNLWVPDACFVCYTLWLPVLWVSQDKSPLIPGLRIICGYQMLVLRLIPFGSLFCGYHKANLALIPRLRIICGYQMLVLWLIPFGGLFCGYHKTNHSLIPRLRIICGYQEANLALIPKRRKDL